MPIRVTPDERRLVALVAGELGLRDDVVRRHDGGWDCSVLEVDGWMIRRARRTEVSDRMAAEQRLLRLLDGRLTVAVPVPELTMQYDGALVSVYRRIEGLPLAESDDPRAVGQFLRELHRVPVGESAAALGVGANLDAWRDGYRELAGEALSRAVPVMPADVADGVRRGFEDVLALDWSAVTPALVHRDLGASHLLMASPTRLSGVLDWTDAAIGDREIDYVGVRITCGIAGCLRAAEAAGHELDLERVHHYYWLGALHAVLYGLQTGDDDEVAAGIRGLRSRLPLTM